VVDIGEEGGMTTETHDKRSYESFSHAGHDILFPSFLSLFLSLSLSLSLFLFLSLSLSLPADLLRRSFTICATCTSSLVCNTVVGRETVFSVHTNIGVHFEVD